MTKITQSFIFAAGRGERMRPLTDTIPKPLVKIKNKAIIDHIIAEIAVFDKIIINGFYLADEIENHIKNLHNKKIVFSREPSKIETGGGLFFAAKNKKFDITKPIFIVNGDILWQGKGDIEMLCNAYQSRDCDILLGLTKTKNFTGYQGKGDFNLLENGNLQSNEGNNCDYTFVGL